MPRRTEPLRAGASTGGAFATSEKRAYSVSRSFAPFFGSSAGPNRLRNAPNAKISLRKHSFQTNSTRFRRIHSAKGAFTLSIDLKKVMPQ